MARAQGIGGAEGTAGVTYALVTTARLLRHPDLLDDALRISRLITPLDIEADDTLDVIGGAAGAILGLLPLWQETGDRTVHDRIVQCGEHLADRQIKENGYAGGWMHEKFMRPLTGFSHGAAGISYALLKACSATGIPRLREVAQRGLEYERSVFVPSQRNWPDFRPSRAGQCGVSWCHGAPGIGLARLGGLSCYGDEESRHEIDCAIQWLLASPARANDHLCCGEFGNLELFLEAGRRLGRADLIRQAQIRGASAIARANHVENGHRAGFESSLGPCVSVFIPGLFDGLAGIGHQMLRLAFPNLVPSVLLWE
jgi:lantibiotic modifying enzyme